MRRERTGPTATACHRAFGDGKAGYVTRADCARAAAAALLTETGSSVRDITGPAAVSQAEIAVILSEATGKEIPYVPITRDALVAAAASAKPNVCGVRIHARLINSRMPPLQ